MEILKWYAVKIKFNCLETRKNPLTFYCILFALSISEKTRGGEANVMVLLW